MEQSIQSLYDFIELAKKNRKYPDNTAQGLKAALKLFESELNDDERKSLKVFKENLDQIRQSVITKNSKDFSVSTINVYKSRIQKIIRDYEKYGVDPSKLADWSPKVINRKPKKQKESIKNDDSLDIDEKIDTKASQMTRFELPLRPDVKSIFIVPQDMTVDEADRIKGILDSLAL